jgi:hypothetical protein
MAVLKIPYDDINQTLRGISTQINDSLDYCLNDMPSFKNPETMFNFLKLNTTYKNDPKGIELLQSVPTLFDNNFWGKPGAGDCDCFTILVCAMAWAQGWQDQEIVLAGRTKKNPTHIYSTITRNGKTDVLDLTEPYFNMERKYKYKQHIKI